MDVFYIDANYLEHGCCWDTAIMKRCEKGKGQYGGDAELLLECKDEDAEFICKVLNDAIYIGLSEYQGD